MTTPTPKARRVQVEATAPSEAAKVSVTFKDVIFEVSPDPMEWGMETLEKLDEGKIASALAGIFGDKQYARFKKLNPSTRDAVNVLNEISAGAGVEDSGN